MSGKKDDIKKTKIVLISELQALRKKNAELESLAEHRKQAEAALKESEEKLRNFIEFTPLGIWCFQSVKPVNINNPEDQMIAEFFNSICIECNDTYASMMGVSKEEILGLKLSDAMPNTDENRNYLKAFIKEGFKLSGGISRELTEGGEEKYFSNSMVGVIKNGKLISAWGTQIDVTEQKRMEEEKVRLESQLHHSRKMEAIGVLAGGIAHNFNNILTGIQGHASLMKVDKGHSSSDYKHLNSIEESVRSAVDLTQQLLGFARGGKYITKPIDLNALIKNENKMFGRTKREIEIHGKYDKQLWAVEADRGQMQQVLLNLYINAWQAMPKGGHIYVQTENVSIDEDCGKALEITPGRYVKTSVTDTGTGMNKEIQKKVFEPFFTTKDQGISTGLGLASAYGIIKNHKGYINVYSEKGKGTTFKIYLPASWEKVVLEKKPPKKSVKGEGTILLVDDESLVIEVGKKLLEKLGYLVLTANSGKEAIREYEKNKKEIKLVILDMIMPVMGGEETFDRLKEIDRDVCVLLSSGYSLNGQAEEILNKGCAGFLQKPFTMNELSEKVSSILEHANGVKS
jgi:PAS domain S-box-containing protein